MNNANEEELDNAHEEEVDTLEYIWSLECFFNSITYTARNFYSAKKQKFYEFYFSQIFKNDDVQDDFMIEKKTMKDSKFKG